MKIPLLKLHHANRTGCAGETEVWVNVAHIVSVAPTGEASIVCFSDRSVVETVESYDWLVEQLTGVSAAADFGRKS